MSRTLPLLLAVLASAALLQSTLHRAAPTGTRAFARSDLPVYLAGAERVLAGQDPLGATSERGWPYVYPPTLAVLLTPLLDLPPRVAAGLWFGVSLAALVAGMLAFRHALGRRGPFHWRADGIPIALVFLSLASGLERGQVGPLLLGLAGLAFLALERRRDVLAGVLVALAAAIKVYPALLLVALALARRGRALAAGLTALLVWILLLPAPFLGLKGSAQASTSYAGELVLRFARDPGSPQLTDEHAFEIHINTNQSFTSQVVRRTTGWPRLALLVLIAAGVLAPTLAACRHGPSPPSATAWALTLAATLLLSPVAWHHQHVLLWPALYLLALRRERRLASWSLALFAVLSTLHFGGKHTLLGDLGLLGLGTLLVGVALLIAEGQGDTRAPLRS